MLKMRLQRIGRRNDASFRVIVTDSRRGPKSGKHIDLLGSYNPKLNQIQIDGEKAKEWMSKGVQVSDTVHNLLVSAKIIEGKKINVLPKKSPIAKEETEKETEAPAKEETVTNDHGKEEKPVEDEKEEASAEEKTEEVKEEIPAEETQEEVKEEIQAEETKKETPSEETKEETTVEEVSKDKK